MDAANPQQLTAFGRFMEEWQQIIAAVDRKPQLGYKYSEANLCQSKKPLKKSPSPVVPVTAAAENGSPASPSLPAAAIVAHRSGMSLIKLRARTVGITTSPTCKKRETALQKPKPDILNDWVLPAFGLIAIACIWYVVVTASGGRIW